MTDPTANALAQLTLDIEAFAADDEAPRIIGDYPDQLRHDLDQILDPSPYDGNYSEE